MPMKKGRDYRVMQSFSPVPREGDEDAHKVRGTAVVFNTPTCLYEYDGVKYYEVIDRHAFDECDMSDVIFNYNHAGKVLARLRNNTLTLTITERGLDMEADLSGTAAGRDLYEEVVGGYVDKMSFSFVVRESKYDSVTHTRTITKIRKLPRRPGEARREISTREGRRHNLRPSLFAFIRGRRSSRPPFPARPTNRDTRRRRPPRRPGPPPRAGR